jgi:hypothetical protein
LLIFISGRVGQTMPRVLTWPRSSLVFVDEGAEDWPMLDPLTGAVGYGMAGL